MLIEEIFMKMFSTVHVSKTIIKVAHKYLNCSYWIRGLFLPLGLTLQLMVMPVSAQYENLPEGLIQYASYVFINGQVLTADSDDDFTVEEAVAVRGNRILAVGASAEILAYAGPATRMIDLQGRSMTPGIIYSNADNALPGGDLVKFSQWGGYTHEAIGGETIEQALLTMATIVDEVGEAGVPIFLNLQDQWAGVASRVWDISTLDEIAPDVPIVVYLDSSHTLANTAMIELAIESGFPPDHLSIGRDERGNFNGRTGGQFSGFVGREIRPWPVPEWFDEVALPRLRDMNEKWVRQGVTGTNGHVTGVTMTSLNRLFHEGDGSGIKIRNHVGLDFPRQNFEAEKYFKRFGNLTDFELSDDRGPMVTVIGVAMGPFSGAPDGASNLLTIEPKVNIIDDLSPNPHGWNKWTGQWFNNLAWEDLTEEQRMQTDYQSLMLARQHGYSATGWYTMGSKAILLTMQFLKEAEEQDNLYVKELWRPFGTIHNIDWMPQNYEYWEAHPEIHDLIRFSVTLRAGLEQRDAEPLGLKNVIELMYGKESLSRMAPLKTLREKNIPFHIEGSNPGNRGVDYPMWHVYKAVTRIDQDGVLIAPEQAIDRKSAILGLTRWTARYVGALDDLGSIEPGKLADLVIFDGNILEDPIEKVLETLPVMTMVGGWVAYEDPHAEL
jgi:predicted amidohydrolase YtcJ